MRISLPIALGTTALVATAAFAQARFQPSAVPPAIVQDAGLTQQVAALTKQVAEQKQQIAQLTGSMKTVSIQGFENLGNLNKLRSAYNRHTHYATLVTVVAGNQQVGAPPTSMPSENCKRISDSGTVNTRYSCTPPN